MKKLEDQISRRGFAKIAALTGAAVALPTTVFAQEEKPAQVTAEKPPEKPGETPKLSAQSQAEADLAYETIIRKYGSRFSEEQKRDIKRLVNSQQSTLDKLRAFNLSNGDQPTTVLKLITPESKR
jgi:hypothetical protein